MIKKDNSTKLRKQAEKQLEIRLKDAEEKTDLLLEAKDRQLYELQVHQIELEMQNEELRRVQMELKTQRDMYSDLYDFAPVGYLTVSEQELILKANLTIATMLGVERRSMIGKHFSKFIAGDIQDVYYFHHQKLIKTKEKQTSELKLVKKDGSEFYAHLESIVIEDAEGNLAWRMAVTDISKRRQTEETLRESEEKYRSMMEAMKDAAYICSPEFRIEYINPAMVDRIGRDVTGKICHKAIYDWE